MIEKVKITSDFITLGQLLKLIGEISNGGHAKFFLEENEVYLNNKIESKRGKKIYKDDIILINDKKIIIY